ncbi:MAG TPA: DUF473 domain-containing protein [Methanosarcinales archaeon]|nr:DUF473 domain-containing protein [Methanosarcinales archaeon]
MKCVVLSGLSNNAMRDLKNRVLRTIEIRSPHNFVSVLHITVGDPVFLSSTSHNDVTTGTTGIIARAQRLDISTHRVVQGNDLFYEERETQMARIQLVTEGVGRVRNILHSKLGGAMMADVEERPIYAAW